MRTIAILLVLGAASPSVAQHRPRIAVMPLKAKRIQKDIVSIMDALLVSQVSRLGQFDVISAADIQAMLEAEGMKDALGCNEVTCAAEIGGALNARSTLAGTVGKLGSTIVINLTLFDNEKMTALRRANVEVKNDEDLFAGAVRSVVGQLFGAQSSAPSSVSGYGAPAAEIFQEPGTLKVTSKPEGAYVIVDGKLAGTTPLEVGLPPGRHQLDVEKKGLGPMSRSIEIRRGQVAAAEAMLGPRGKADSARSGQMLVGVVAIVVGSALMVGTLVVNGAVQQGIPPEVGLPVAIGGACFLIVGIVATATLPNPQPVPRYLHKIDQLERLSTVDSRRSTLGLSLAFQF
jgi:TolB-like protein